MFLSNHCSVRQGSSYLGLLSAVQWNEDKLRTSGSLRGLAAAVLGAAEGAARLVAVDVRNPGLGAALLTLLAVPLLALVVREQQVRHVDQFLPLLGVGDAEVVQLVIVQILEEGEVLVPVEHEDRKVLRHVQHPHHLRYRPGRPRLTCTHFSEKQAHQRDRFSICRYHYIVELPSHLHEVSQFSDNQEEGPISKAFASPGTVKTSGHVT